MRKRAQISGPGGLFLTDLLAGESKYFMIKIPAMTIYPLLFSKSTLVEE